jgi:hypothetical protein
METRIARRGLALGLSIVLLPASLAAQTEPEQPEEKEPPNEVALFIGGTTSTERDETSFTLGGDYLRRVGERWSLGAFAEAVFADPTTWILGPQIRLHVKKGFWLAFEPALELAVEESEEAHEAEREARAIFRIGTGYDFELGKFSVSPNLSVDLSKEKPSWLWGINIGRAFGSAGE